MNITLWILQAVLAFMFGMAGMMKATQSIPTLERKMGWVGEVPSWQVRLAGYAEILGAAGLLLPWALGVVPILTPLAAIGLAVIMLLAIPVHLRRDEMGSIAINVLLVAVTGFVAFGRLMA